MGDFYKRDDLLSKPEARDDPTMSHMTGSAVRQFAQWEQMQGSSEAGIGDAQTVSGQVTSLSWPDI